MRLFKRQYQSLWVNRVLWCLTWGIHGLLLPLMYLLGIRRATRGRMRLPAELVPKTAIVFGCGLNIADHSVSPLLQERMDSALALYQRFPDTRFILSGGVSIDGRDEPAAMRRALLVCGIPEAQLVIDRNGLNTFASIRSAKERFHVERVIMVSGDYHLRRCVYVAVRQGIDAYALETPLRRSPRRFYQWLREEGALLNEWFRATFGFGYNNRHGRSAKQQYYG